MTRWNRHGLLMAALAWTLAGCGGGAKVASDVAVQVEEQSFTYTTFEGYLDDNAGRAELAPGEGLSDPVLTSLLDSFVDQHLLVRLATDLGLGSGVGDGGLGQRQAVELLLRRAHPSPSTPQEIAAYYDKHQSRWSHPEQLHLWQILMVNRERAEGIKRDLDRGADFKATATGLADDPDANYCGDQGWLGHEDLPASFAELIFNLEPGMYSDVVAADYGYYLFWVADRKTAQVEPVEAVAHEIRAALAHDRSEQAMTDAIEEARSRYNVRVFPTNLPFDYQGLYAELQED